MNIYFKKTYCDIIQKWNQLTELSELSIILWILYVNNLTYLFGEFFATLNTLSRSTEHAKKSCIIV